MKAWLLGGARAASLAIGAQAAPHPAFAPDRLARIDRLLQGYVDSNRIGGAVALVLRYGKVAYQTGAAPTAAHISSIRGNTWSWCS